MEGKLFTIIVLCFFCCLSGPSQTSGSGYTEDKIVRNIPTFYEKKDKEICTKDGKPMIYLFSTTWCSHGQWIAETFDRVAKEYISQDQIIAFHWELDTNDDALTDVQENAVPKNALAVYKEFNPHGSIPTFVFGCKYYRIGNGYEHLGNLQDEEEEFRALIEHLIAELNPAETKEASSTQKSHNDELDYEINNSGILTFSWTPASSNPDYYKVFVAVDPKDPHNVQPEELDLVTTTTNQPFFSFLGEKDRVYVLQAQAVRKHPYLVTIYRKHFAEDVSARFYCITQRLQEDYLIKLPEAEDQVIGFLVDVFEVLGPKSKPSKSVLCLTTNTDPEKAKTFIRIPAK